MGYDVKTALIMFHLVLSELDLLVGGVVQLSI